MQYLFEKYPGVYQGRGKYNQYQSHPICYEFNYKDVDEFNKIYEELSHSDLYYIERTNSGSISNKGNLLTQSYAWDIFVTDSYARITVLYKGIIRAFRVGSITKENKTITPSNAWKKFIKVCLKHGLNLDDYKLPLVETKDNKKVCVQGQLVKTEIKYKISMNQTMSKKDEGLSNCHHIDFHNSYPAGLANTHPEFKPAIEEIYSKRKDKDKKTSDMYKSILNYSIGCMQSEKFPWRCQWAHLAKDAILDNVKRIEELSNILEKTGRKILGYNTDGIWYQGEIYHGPGEGDNLGEWHNDHVNCLFRNKSNGVYEFIEDGKYNPVVRGHSTYDAIVPRDKWTWGDIYKGHEIMFDFDEDKGIILKGGLQ